MKYSKQDCLTWLKNLNRTQFEEVVTMVLDEAEQVTLSKPVGLIDPSTFVNDAKLLGRLPKVTAYLEVHFLRQRPPEIAVKKHRSTRIPDPENLPFTDRLDQIVKILYFASAPYLILDAPYGFGKTELLKHLSVQFSAVKWNTLYVELNGSETFPEACTKIIRSIPSPAELELGVPVDLTTSSEICKTAQKKPGAGVALLIDIAGQPMPELLDFLANTLVKTVNQALLSGVGVYQQILHPFRVILAGRYSTAWQTQITFKLPFTWLALPPFDLEIIRSAAFSYLNETRFSSIDQIAAHTFYLTGGHPALIAKILVDYKNFPVDPDSYLAAKNEYIWLNWIAPSVDKIHLELLASFPKLAGVLDLITMFRVLDDPCLQDIVNKDEFKTFVDCYNLQELLTQTNIFQQEPYLVKDCLVRRLLAIRIWRTNPLRFLELNLHAQDFCLANIANTPSPPYVWALEYLFQFLHGSVLQVQDEAQRNALRDNFYKNAVPQMLAAYLGRSGLTAQTKRGEMKALKERLKQDWEFQFTINYYLRHDQYDNSPYQELVERL